MKILVTGGAGFIGSHLIQRLQEVGHSVVVVDDFSTGFRENLSGFSGRVVEGSILDPECMASVLEDVELVYHLAAFTSAPGSMAEPLRCADLNVAGLLTMLLAAGSAGCKRIIFASSAAVYGNGPELPKLETLPPSPESPYALTKLDGEYYLQLLGASMGIKTASIRFFNVFGPRQDVDSGYAAAVPNFCHRAWSGGNIEIYGDGGQTRDFIYVEDLVGALCHVGESSECDGVYNAGYGVSMEIQTLAEKIIDFTGSSSQIVNQDERPGDVRHSLANVDRLKATGWSPLIGFEEGLSRTVGYFEARPASRRE